MNLNLSAISVCRPDWSRCSECLGEDRWKQLSGEKSSKELVQVLLNEIQGTNDSVKDYFTGLVCCYPTPRSLPVFPMFSCVFLSIFSNNSSFNYMLKFLYSTLSNNTLHLTLF